LKGLQRFKEHLQKYKQAYVICITLAIVLSIFVVNPVQAAPRAYPVTQFAEQNMSVFLDLEINVTMPEADGYLDVGSQIIKVRFPFMLEEADTGNAQDIASNEQILPMIAESKASEYVDPTAPIKRAHTYYNGTIAYTNLTLASQSSVTTTGVKYKGIIPSPAQLAYFVCWRLGYTLNNITSANTSYETGSPFGQRPDYMIEQRSVNISVDENLADGMINTEFANQSEADLCAQDIPSGDPVKMNILFCVEGSGDEADASGLAGLILVGVVVSIFNPLAIIPLAGVVTASIVHDLSGHAAQEELAEAYRQGFEAGADAQELADRETIWQLFQDGNITAEQCQALLDAIGENNDVVKSNFTNPYEIGDYYQWSDITITVMSVITLIIIIIIIVVIIAIVYYVYKWWRKRNSVNVAINVNSGAIKRA